MNNDEQPVLHCFIKSDLFLASVLVGFGISIGAICGCCTAFTIAKIILWVVGQ